MTDRTKALWEFDLQQCDPQIEYVVGVDEAGRGSLAGDMYAAAVVLRRGSRLMDAGDSKQLSAKQRANLAEEIRNLALAWGVATVSHLEIDERGIDWANRVLLTRAVRMATRELPNCHRDNTLVLIDGIRPPYRCPFDHRLIKGGDKLSLVIGAASILAKTERDRYCIDELEKAYPDYGFAQHKGYGTKAHFAAIAEHGPSTVHRMSFRLQRSS